MFQLYFLKAVYYTLLKLNLDLFFKSEVHKMKQQPKGQRANKKSEEKKA